MEDAEIKARIANKDKTAYRRGYLGHAVKIGQIISTMAEKNTQINEYLAGTEFVKQINGGRKLNNSLTRRLTKLTGIWLATQRGKSTPTM